MLKKIIKTAGLIFLVICFFTACSNERLLLDDGEKETQGTDVVQENEFQSGEENLTQDVEIMSTTQSICVHVCGAVANPGVYELTPDCRIYEAVEAAGGFDAEADREAINLVETLADGEQIRIPYIGENNIATDNGKIDINSADADTLCEIPGIGESRARAIVDYRNEHGEFQSVEELMQVSGIKEGLFAKIYPYIECR